MSRRKPPAAAAPLNAAPPRRHVPTGTYLGGELQRTSNRPGAYDAFDLPSKFGRQHVAPGARPIASAPAMAERRIAAVLPTGHAAPRQVSPELKSLVTPATTSARAPRPLKPTPRGASLSPYVSHPGSTPTRVIAALQAEGGMLTYADISERFGVPPGSVTAVLKAALLKGALVRHVSHGQRVRLHLPGYLPPPEPTAAAPAPTPAIAASMVAALAASSAQLEALAHAQAKALDELSAAAAAASKALLAKAKEIDQQMRAVSAAARTPTHPARRAP